MRTRLAVIAAVAAAVLGVLIAISGSDPDPLNRTEREQAEQAERELEPVQPLPTPTGTRVPVPRIRPSDDPFRYSPDRREEFEARAAAGNAHVLYALSPDGVIATAERVERWRPKVQAAAETAGVDPDRLEALVFLESAGRDQVIAPQGIEGAVGLTQIVAGTGIDLLGMPIDVAESIRLTNKLDRTLRPKRIRALMRKRKQADPRFDATRALAATGRYLSLAEDRFDSEELAFVSYHMGIGNLEGILNAYAGGPTEHPLRYAQVYFDSSPTRNPDAWRRLYELGDDSSNYLWKLAAARQIMALWREDPAALAAAADQQLRKNSAEEVLHPEEDTVAFEGPDAVRDAFAAGELSRLPRDPERLGLRFARQMGAQAKRLEEPRTLYRGLRPAALATLLYIGRQVREGGGGPDGTLKVTSTVRDLEYQAKLVQRNREATPNFSLHTTGYAFDIARKYASDAQARAFQAVLDRLRSLNLIAYVYEPAAIHVTVAEEAKAFSPLLRGLAVEPAP